MDMEPVKDRPRLDNSASLIVCYAPSMITTNGIWQGDSPLEFSLPIFLVQLLIILSILRSVAFVLKPLRHPRFLSDALGGVILGPTIIGKIPKFLDLIFPTRSVVVLETLGNLGLVFFFFLVGLQVDIAVVKRTGRKAWAIAAPGVLIPFTIAALSFLIFKPSVSPGHPTVAVVLFLGVSTSVTAFSVLSRILAEIKLLTSEVGKLASAVALIGGGAAWMLLAAAIAASKNKFLLQPLAVIFSGFAVIFLLYVTVRPAVAWVLRRTPEGEPVSEAYICLFIVAVMACGIVGDAIGVHAVFAAFVFGIMVPGGPVGAALVEKLEDFVSGLLMPLFFAVVGIKADISVVTNYGAAAFLVGIAFLGAAAKVGVTVLVSSFFGMPTREGLSLGILLNTKGLFDLLALYLAYEDKVIDQETFTVMVLLSIALTAAATPAAAAAYRQARQLLPYKRRTLLRSRPDSELRVLACVHSTRNVPSIISMLEVSHPSKRSPIFVYALHLVELTGRDSAMLAVHETDTQHHNHHHHLNKAQAQSEQINHAFETYEQHAGGVSIQPVTAMSAYSNMHEDVCNIAEEKRVALIILSFHKQQTVDGGMEVTNPGIRTVNQGVLANAPCSVAVLVDRGLGGTARVATGQLAAHHVALLFFGGADDREALAYAWRMAGHPGISLTVVRFVYSAEMGREDSAVIDVGRSEREIDEEILKDFWQKNVNDESVAYVEKTVRNGEETVAAIRAMDDVHDLYVVGRGKAKSSPLTEGLTDWSECPELGVIGDLLASPDFGATVSVLIVQQYAAGGGDEPGSPESPSIPVHQRFFNMGKGKP